MLKDSDDDVGLKSNSKYVSTPPTSSPSFSFLASKLLFKYHYVDTLESFRENDKKQEAREYIKKFRMKAREYEDSLLANSSFEILQSYYQIRKNDINLFDLEHSVLDKDVEDEQKTDSFSEELQKLEQQNIDVFDFETLLFYHKRKVNAKNATFRAKINEKIPFSYEFVGSGENYSDCGEWFSVGCLNVDNHSVLDFSDDYSVSSSGKAFVRATTRCCRRARCPVCFESWAHHQAVKAEHRLLCFSIGKKLIDQNGDVVWDFSDVEEIYSESLFKLRHKYIQRAFRSAKYGKKPIHVSVSFKDSYFSSDPKKLRKLAIKTAKMVDLSAGCVVFHPFRRKNKQKNAYSYENVYYSPHFHVVGFGFPQGNKIASISRELGVNVYNHGLRESVYHTLKYELSHCAIKKRTHALTWFGDLAYNNFSRLPEIPNYDALCPLCQGKLQRVIWVGDGDNPLECLLGDFLVDPANWQYDVLLNSWTGG